MEAHFIFVNSTSLAILGIWFDFSNGKDDDIFLSQISNDFPLKSNQTNIVKILDLNILGNYIKNNSNDGLYSYLGSLTSPPCTEHVKWTVLKTPIKTIGIQLKQFYSSFPFNSRKPQSNNGRKTNTFDNI